MATRIRLANARRRLRGKIESLAVKAKSGGLPDCWVQIVQDALILAEEEIRIHDELNRIFAAEQGPEEP